MTQTQALVDWLDSISGEEWTWFAKRLSANDTGLTKSHQRGIYLPKEVAFPLLGLAYPALNSTIATNPSRGWTYWLVSHDQRRELRLIYYNTKTRNECRITGFGGKASPVLDPDNASALFVMAFHPDGQIQSWLAQNADEAGVIEDRIGPIVPGFAIHRRQVEGRLRLDELVPGQDVCDVSIDELPVAWRTEFPAQTALTEEAVRRTPSGLDPDTRMLRRYECEFRIFRAVEEAQVLTEFAQGFPSVDQFLAVAQTVLNRRKSRAVRALELQLAEVFAEEGVANEPHSVTEPGSVVDFVFPSLRAYLDADDGSAHIHMLAVETTLKDRWHLVLGKAQKVRPKHLFTLDQGVSLSQYQEITAAGVVLVVPQRNVSKFPEHIRLSLLTLSAFLDVVRS